MRQHSADETIVHALVDLILRALGLGGRTGQGGTQRRIVERRKQNERLIRERGGDIGIHIEGVVELQILVSLIDQKHIGDAGLRTKHIQHLLTGQLGLGMLQIHAGHLRTEELVGAHGIDDHTGGGDRVRP